MTSPGTLWRTVRHLKLGQITGRLAFLLRRPAPNLDPAPRRKVWQGPWVRPAARRPSLLEPLRFSLLGVEGDVSQVGWDGPGPDKLWRYNQHYFDDLNAQDAEGRRAWHAALITRWLAGNPPAHGTGWEPYPTSLRIANWVKASASGLALAPAAWQSLAIQARWLTQRMEWHLLGNHLFVNAKALVLAGLAFDGPEANGWRQEGLTILREQLQEQVLPDGGQFERSPMYHALALEDLLDLINVAQAAQDPMLQADIVLWRKSASKMLRWLRAMTHPDGRLARFNDCADGIAPSGAELRRYAAALGVSEEVLPTDGQVHLADSGYLRMNWADAAAILDLAPIGPDYLPGHAHADTLSFELSVNGRLLIVNGGTSCYGLSSRRLQERGTATHSTVQVAGLDSSEVWSGFRVGRRARTRDIEIGEYQVSGSHDGYRWLPGRPRHKRNWRFDHHFLEVEDEVSVPGLPALARYHLGPGLTLKPAGPDTWLVQADGVTIARVVVPRGDGRIEASHFAPEFGTLLPTWCLAVECEGGRALTRWHWP